MTVRCPSCGTQIEWENSPERPFCSQMCRLKDLGRWATEEYRLPAEESQSVDAPVVSESAPSDEENDPESD